MNKILAVLVSIVIIAGMMPMMPLASAISQVQVANKAPVVTNAQCNASALTVNNYYKITFDLQDANRVKTTKNITVNVWVNSTTEPTTNEAKRSAYIFKWNQTAQTWYGPTYGSTYVDNSSSTNVNTSNAATTTVEVVFKLDKIAVPTNTYTWEINVTVYDDGDLTDYDLNTSAFDVQKYSELSATGEAGIDFGTADPGAQVGNLSVDNATYQTTVTITSNTQTDVNITGGDFSGTIDTIYGTRFYFNTTNVTDVSASGKGVVQLSNSSAKDAYDTFRNVSDSLSAGITGYTDVKAPGLAFNGSIQEPCAPGTYQATWTITAEATNPQ